MLALIPGGHHSVVSDVFFSCVSFEDKVLTLVELSLQSIESGTLDRAGRCGPGSGCEVLRRSSPYSGSGGVSSSTADATSAASTSLSGVGRLRVVKGLQHSPD